MDNVEDEEDSFNMEDFEKFNDEIENLGSKGKFKSKLDKEDYDLLYNNEKDKNKDKDDDEEDEIDNEEDLYDDVDMEEDENITYKKMYKKSNKEDKEESLNDDEIENDIFAEEHGYNKKKDKENEALREKIEIVEEIHNKMLGDKPWEMKGEIKAKDRPIGSLLDSNLDFKVTKRPIPIVTAELSLKIEKLIKLRISKDLYDDPKRYSYLTDNENNENKGFEINFDKSKKGLAELYEEDYNRLNEDKTTEVKSQEKIEIEDLMEELFTMFTAVTSNTFVSQRVKENMNVIKDVDAIELKDISKNIVNNHNVINNKSLSNKEIEEKTAEIRKNKNKKGMNLFIKSNEEMDRDELKSKHRALKRKLKKKIYEKNLDKQRKALLKDYDSKFEVDLKLKQKKDKIEKSDIKSKELKSTKFFDNIQNNKEKYTKENSKNNYVNPNPNKNDKVKNHKL